MLDRNLDSSPVCYDLTHLSTWCFFFFFPLGVSIVYPLITCPPGVSVRVLAGTRSILRWNSGENWTKGLFAEVRAGEGFWGLAAGCRYPPLLRSHRAGTEREELPRGSWDCGGRLPFRNHVQITEGWENILTSLSLSSLPPSSPSY